MQGIRLLAHPTSHQKHTLSQWMGCAKTIWNAKCDDEKYMTRFARRYCPIKIYAPIDQTFSQYKNEELTPWLYDCPSQILRNSAVNWYRTYQKFMKGLCGKPRRKRFKGFGSIHLTRELFCFERCEDGNTRLFIGSKRNNISYLSFKRHRHFKMPNSIYITKHHGRYWLSFSYGEAETDNIAFNKENLTYLKDASNQWLEKHTIGIDRGIVRPLQAGNKTYDFTDEQKSNKKGHEKSIKRLQRRLSKQQKGSNRYKRTKRRLSNRHQKIANIRKDFCHHSTHKIVNNKAHKVIVLEDLRTKQMTRRPKAKGNVDGSYAPNHASSKAGLNKRILDKGWHLLEQYIAYKSQRLGKAFFKVSAHYTSQACAACDHTHPDNRKSQELFICDHCGHTDNADVNASMVIKQRAIKLLLDSGTELSKRGVLTTKDKGRGDNVKTLAAHVASAIVYEASKKKRTSVAMAAA